MKKENKGNEMMLKDSVVNLSDLFKQAIEKNASVETLERLMKIRQEIKNETAKEVFNTELNQLQEEIPVIEPDCEVKNPDGSVRYRYASLRRIMEVIQPLLSKHGFSVSFETDKTEKGEVKVVCILRHILGHSEKSSFIIPMETSRYMSDIQRMGSTLTYAKRYALNSMLNITTSDDSDSDGIEAEIVAKEAPKETTAKPANEIKTWKISNAQIKLVQKICKDKGINQDYLYAVLEEKFNIQHLHDLKSNEEFNILLNELDPEGAEERKRRHQEWENQLKGGKNV